MASLENLHLVFPLVAHCLFWAAGAVHAPSNPNTSLLLLFNCSLRIPESSSLAQDCSLIRAADEEAQYLCSYMGDIKKPGIWPNSRKALNCSNYRSVYINSMDEYKLATRMSVHIPDHVPNLCDQCKNPGGHCGVGLKCICHPKECKEQLISRSGPSNIFA
ncbi:uncharacterized protein LOC116212439 isoform X2 [Punica granatum]|uniref:Uncharacterized protein LOC116212439 isoform X2 n=1 Tax=Punica granatum TaxID=22663 RepID=A0A6P8DZB9_PUNGR|nr:uncharacterized protein LOC116212439 isoform X2 [Punica granatum]